MRKNEDKDTRYFIDLDLISNTIINWDYDNRHILSEEKLDLPGFHRVYLSKGQYNKIVKKSMGLK